MVNNMPRWTEEELDILVKNYGINPIATWMNQLPRRTWSAIQTKAHRIGLVSELYGSRPVIYKPSLPEVDDVDFEELWESLYLTQRASQKLSTRLDDVDIYVDTDQPIGVPFIADAHIGAISAPLDYIRTRFDMIADCPRFYPFSVGDTHENYLPGKHPQGTFGVMFPPELQKELVINLYSKLKGRWLGAVQGCHEEFSHTADDFDFTKYLAHQLDCANLGFGGLVKLYVGEQVYKIAIRHKYKYHSSLNPSHTCKRLVQMEYPEADISVVAHNHRAVCVQLTHRDKDRVYVRPGSLKGPDRYARSIGFTDTGASIPTVILYPNKRLMLPFLHLEQAIEVFRGLDK